MPEARANEARCVGIEAAWRALRDRFRRAGLATPDLDARLLVCHTFGVSPTALVRDPARPADVDCQAALEDAAERRLRGEPVARIVGEREFWSLPFRLSPDTLEPRPDSETLVAATLERLRGAGLDRAPLRILDIGTGSGAILVALLSELPVATAIGSDISTGALMTARGNAGLNGVAGRAGFVCADTLCGLAGPFDVVVANPPYIPSGDIAALAPEVAHHDPRVALDGGADGLDVYRAIFARVATVLRRPGLVALEVGTGQAAAVAAMAGKAGFPGVATVCDLAGQARVVVAMLPLDDTSERILADAATKALENPPDPANVRLPM